MKRGLSHRAAVGVWLAVILLAAWTLTHTRFTADMSAFLPANPSEEQRLLVEQLQEGGVSRTFLLAIEGGTAERRADRSPSRLAA